MTIVDIKNIAKQYDDSAKSLEAIKDISFSINKGEFVSIFGPNGSGKSTLFEILLGISKPNWGDVAITPGIKTSFVFQNYRDTLMPWASVLENVLLALESSQMPESLKLRKAKKVLSEIGLQRFQDAHIYDLSGGMVQLVALARAIVTDPDLLLIDEPFSALDYQRSIEMQKLLSKLCKRRSLATLMISHDIDEAIYLSDKIIVLSSRPSTVKEILSISFTGQKEERSRTGSRFTHYRKKLLRIIESNEISF